MVLLRWACLALILMGASGCDASSGPAADEEATKQKEAQIDRFKARDAKAARKPMR